MDFKYLRLKCLINYEESIIEVIESGNRENNIITKNNCKIMDYKLLNISVITSVKKNEI